MPIMKVGSYSKYRIDVKQDGKVGTAGNVLAPSVEEAKKLVVRAYGTIDFTLTPIAFSAGAERNS